ERFGEQPLPAPEHLAGRIASAGGAIALQGAGHDRATKRVIGLVKCRPIERGEGFHHLQRVVVFEACHQLGGHGIARVAGGFLDQLCLAPREVVIDRAARRAREGEHVRERRAFHAPLGDEEGRAANHLGARVRAHAGCIMTRVIVRCRSAAVGVACRGAGRYTMFRTVMRCGFALMALVALAAPGSALANWPIYGHDLANSRTAKGAGPSLSELPSLQQAWKFSSPTGDFTATPVVPGGVLVAGDNGGTVYALDAATGKVRWSRHVGQPINGSSAIDLHAPGGPAVFVPVAQSGAPRLLALSLRDGAPRWNTVLTRQASANVFGSPVCWHGAVYIGTSGPNNDNTHARGSVVAVDESRGH